MCFMFKKKKRLFSILHYDFYGICIVHQSVFLAQDCRFYFQLPPLKANHFKSDQTILAIQVFLQL